MNLSSEKKLELYQKIRMDPWLFACLCVRTLDQVDKANPVKDFPKDKDYLKLYAKLWTVYPMIAVPKSRRMFMSWMNIILYLHDTMFNIGRHNAFVSKKEDDADDLIERALFIQENLRLDYLPKDLIPKAKRKYCMLEFPELNSKIQGFPQGEDQMRQFTLSGILADEIAFWEKAEGLYSASIPTLEGGGRFTGISSPAPGFFKRLVFDMLDNGEADATDVTLPSDRKNPMEGVEIWINPKNRFLVFQAHHSADPKKTPEYISKIKNSMPIKKYMQEYELQWETHIGEPVFPDWSKKIHGVYDEPIKPQLGLPLFVGVDWGLTPAAVICQLQGDTLVVLSELTETNMGAERFLVKLSGALRRDYPAWADFKNDIQMFIDPSGFYRKDTDESTCAKIAINKGFNPKPSAILWEERRTSVENFLTRQYRGEPSFKVNLGKCPILVKGFDGGYRYPEKAFEIEPSKIRPVKDIHSHVADALQMVTSALVKMNFGPPVKIPALEYRTGR